MSKNRSLVRCALGLLLAILVIVGGIFGFNVKVEVEDTSANETTLEETVATEDVALTEKV